MKLLRTEFMESIFELNKTTTKKGERLDHENEKNAKNLNHKQKIYNNTSCTKKDNLGKDTTDAKREKQQ